MARRANRLNRKAREIAARAAIAAAEGDPESGVDAASSDDEEKPEKKVAKKPVMEEIEALDHETKGEMEDVVQATFNLNKVRNSNHGNITK
jgi:hypothetical protein